MLLGAVPHGRNRVTHRLQQQPIADADAVSFDGLQMPWPLQSDFDCCRQRSEPQLVAVGTVNTCLTPPGAGCREVYMVGKAWQ